MKISYVSLPFVCVGVLAPLMLAEKASAQAGNQIETVVVTAEKHSQMFRQSPSPSTPSVPINCANPMSTTSTICQKISPSLLVYSTTSGASDTSIKIRGVGTTGNNPGLEGAVGTFIDGVYRNRSGLALGDLVDVSQVEVLEGPQSTLFGKNTSAGALNIATNLPTSPMTRSWKPVSAITPATKSTAGSTFPFPTSSRRAGSASTTNATGMSPME